MEVMKLLKQLSEFSTSFDQATQYFQHLTSRFQPYYIEILLLFKNCILYSFGVMPAIFLKSWVKWEAV